MSTSNSAHSNTHAALQVSEETREQLSALLDDNIETNELDTLLSNLSGNAALRQKATQWNLIGDAIRAGAATSQGAISSTQSQTAGSQPADNVIRPDVSRWQKISKPLGGIALAAGVAAVAILVGQQDGPAGAAANFTADNSAVVAPLGVAPLGVAPVGDNSLPPLTDSQRRGLMAASTGSNNKPVSAMSASELAQQARVSSDMNDFTSYQPITREELLELQQPSLEQ